MSKIKVDGAIKCKDKKDKNEKVNYKPLLANQDIFSMEVSSIFYVDCNNSSQQNRKKPTTNSKVNRSK